jgi:hypothetical protein
VCPDAMLFELGLTWRSPSGVGTSRSALPC